MAIARMLLILSSSLGIILGLLFFTAGVYGLVNTNLLNRFVHRLDVRSAPKAAALKREIMRSLEQSGIVQTGAWILLGIGIYATCLSCLGIVVSVADMRIFAKFYIFVKFMTIIGSLGLVLLLTVGISVIEKPIQDHFVETLNKKFVSIVALFRNRAGNGMAVTVIFNYIQLKFGCCGIRKVGDIRSSRRWRGSPRSLASMLKLQPGSADATSDAADENGKDKTKAMDDGDTEDAAKLIKNRVPQRKLLVVAYTDIPDWLKERMPAGASLPDGVSLPAELPAGFVLPKRFQLTQEILTGGGEAVNKAFDDSLIMRTPVTCCRFKGKTSVTTLNVRTLVSRMVDPACPFEAKNSMAVHNKTCHERALNLLNQHSIIILICACALGLYLSCNMTLAIQIMLQG